MPGYFYGTVYGRNVANTAWNKLGNASVCANICASSGPCCTKSSTDTDHKGEYSIPVPTGTVVTYLCARRTNFKETNLTLPSPVTVAEGGSYGPYDIYMARA